MWLPTTDPSERPVSWISGSKGRKARRGCGRAHSPRRSWGNRLYSAGSLRQSARFTEAAKRGRAQLSGLADLTNPDLIAFAARRQADRRHRRGGHAGVARRAARPLPGGARQDGPRPSTVRPAYVLPQGNHGMTATTARSTATGKEMAGDAAADHWNRFRLLVDWVEKNARRENDQITGGDHAAALFFSAYRGYTTGPTLRGELVLLRGALGDNGSGIPA